jgi:TonB family protein
VRIAEFSGQWEGRTIDGFPLEQFLGAGESSAVFLTRYETRAAAIKLVSIDAQKADAQLARWRAASQLSHPNLMRIFSTGRGELDGKALLYVVMERADEDLSQVVPDRPLSGAETRAMLEPTLAALDYIHRQGFVHSHLKPANIMAVDDQVKLSSDSLCRAGVNCGDPPSPYEPPEGASGINAAGDIWALGLTLVEVLTQRLPAGEMLPANLPEPFAEIALHCLDRNPKDRWSVAQISRYLVAPAPVAIRKRRSFAPVGVIILLVLLVVVVVGVMVKHEEAAPAKEVPKQVPQEIAKAPEPEPVKTVKPPRAVKTTEAAPPAALLEASDEPMPDITEQARRTIHGRVVVDVTVDVDPSGAVTNAKLDHAGGSKYLPASALKAARQWKFKPADTAQQWRVRFEFRSTGTKAQSQRLSP